MDGLNFAYWDDGSSADTQGAAVAAGTLSAGSVLQAQYNTGNGTLTPVTFLIGLIGLLVLMKVLGESSKTDIEPAHLHIGGYNLVAVTVTSVVGIVLLKVIFNKFQVPGITDLVNAA